MNGEIARSAAEEAKKKALEDLEGERTRSRSLSNDIDCLKGYWRKMEPLCRLAR